MYVGIVLPMDSAIGAEGRLPRTTVTKITASWPLARGKPEFLVYGNKKFGYFRSGRFTYRAGKISFTFVPPGFREALRISACRGERCVLLKRLTSKPASFYEPSVSYVIDTTGRPSWRFMLLTGRLPLRACGEKQLCTERCEGPAFAWRGDRPAAMFAYLVNVWGEVVWAHVLPPRVDRSSWIPTIAKALPNGRIGILTGSGLARYYEIDVLTGELRREDLNTIIHNPLAQHDFSLEEENLLTVLTSRKESYRRPWRWQTFWQLPSFRPFLFEKPAIETVDLNTKTVVSSREVNAVENPFSNTHWLSRYGVYVSSVMQDSGERAINYARPNSLQRVADGYLLSLHAQSRVVFLADAGRESSWALGSSQQDDFRVVAPDLPFHRQHHVSQLPDGDLLLFDNLGDAERGSRVLRIQLDRARKQAKIRKAYYPDPPLFTDRHGSAVLLPNGNIAGYFAPKPDAPCADPSVLVEFDGVTGAEVSRTSFFGLGVAAMGYRALPLDAVGPAEFLGAEFHP